MHWLGFGWSKTGFHRAGPPQQCSVTVRYLVCSSSNRAQTRSAHLTPINKLDHSFRNSINMVHSSSSRPRGRPVVIAYLGLISAFLLSGIVDHSAPFFQCCEGFALVVLGRRAVSSSAFLTRIGSSTSSTSTSSVIIEPGDGTVEEQDTGRGGVRLAQESVIKILGRFQPGDDDEVELSDLFRYTQVTEVAESFASSCVVYTGTGIEYYQQPDDIVGTTAEVRFAPMEAVRNALQAGKVSNNALNRRISINFCGGKDAQVLEVMEAGTEFARTLRRDNLVPTSTIIEFRSISDDAFPTGASCVTVVAVTQEDNNRAGEETTATTSSAAAADAVARGEVYRSQATGQYYTLLPEHINTAVE
jgi:hypothetical protein